MNKLLFILIALTCTTLNLSGQHYIVPVKYINAQNIAALLNSPCFHNYQYTYTSIANNDKELTIVADEQTYLKLAQVIRELDLPLPKATLEVWDGEKWLY